MSIESKIRDHIRETIYNVVSTDVSDIAVGESICMFVDDLVYHNTLSIVYATINDSIVRNLENELSCYENQSRN